MENNTAQELRDNATRLDAAAVESFDRCDTDGFLSQWAFGVCASRDRLKAHLVENGGMWEFPALVDAETGAALDAKQIKGKYGYCWMIKSGGAVRFAPLASCGDYRWDEEKKDHVPANPVDEFGYTLKSQKTLAKKGVRQVKVMKPGKVIMVGSSAASVHPCVVEA